MDSCEEHETKTSEGLSMRLLWAILAAMTALAVGGGTILIAQVRSDIDSGNRREARLSVLEKGHEDFEQRMNRFEDKLDAVLENISFVKESLQKRR